MCILVNNEKRMIKVSKIPRLMGILENSFKSLSDIIVYNCVELDMSKDRVCANVFSIHRPGSVSTVGHPGRGKSYGGRTKHGEGSKKGTLLLIFFSIFWS